MIIDHKRGIFDVPSDETVLWKYMSLEKFINLIKTKTLYFCRIDCFEDKTEGMLTTIDKQVFHSIGLTEKEWESIRKEIYINCWIESPHELALMWETYGKGGLAIRTTVGNMRKSLLKSGRNEHIGRVRYLESEDDHTQVSTEPLNYLKPSMTKRKYFKQEQEVRLLYHEAEGHRDKEGIPINIDIIPLIKQVVVYPKAMQTFIEAIKDLVEKNGIDREIVIPSKLILKY